MAAANGAAILSSSLRQIFGEFGGYRTGALRRQPARQPLDAQLVLVFLKDLLPFLHLVELLLRILRDELIYVQVAASDAYFYRVTLLNFHVDSSLSKSIDTFRLPQEEDLEPLLFRTVVDILRQLLIQRAILLWDVYFLMPQIFLKLCCLALQILLCRLEAVVDCLQLIDQLQLH